MKKFLLFLFGTMTILGAIFAYILYTEGAFQGYETRTSDDKKLKPFVMKCESGKCGGDKSTGE